MKGKIKSFVMSSLVLNRLNHYASTKLELLKLKASISYVKGVRSARQAAIAVVAGIFAVCLTLCGLLLIHLSILLYSPFSVQTRVIITVVSGLLYIGIAVFASKYFFSEKRWMDFSHAEELIKKHVLNGNAGHSDNPARNRF